MTREERDAKRAEFIRRWRNVLAGTIVLGGDNVRKAMSGGNVQAELFGKSMLDLAPTTDGLLGRMFDDMNPVPPTDPPAKKEK